MPRHLIALIVCIIFFCGIDSHATAQETPVLSESLTENPPQILVASAIDSDGQLVLVSYKTIYIGFSGYSYNNRSTTNVSLNDVRIMTTDGNDITLEAARKQISEHDTPILVSSHKAALPGFFANMFAPSTLHFIFPERAPEWKQIQEPGRPVQK